MSDLKNTNIISSKNFKDDVFVFKTQPRLK